MLRGVSLVCVGLVLAISVIQPGDGSWDSVKGYDENQRQKVSRATTELFRYISSHCDEPKLTKEQCLQSVNRAAWIGMKSSLRFGAALLAHLNSFEQCNKRAVREIFYILKDLPFTEPGRTYQINTMQDMLHVAVFNGAKKCKSYLEQMFQERDKQVSGDTRRLLVNVFTPDVLKNSRLLLGDIVVSATSRDSELSKQVASMQEDELKQFYKKYVADNVVAPCRDYVRTMSPVLSIAERFSILDSQHIGALFDKPSDQFKDALRLFRRCQGSIGRKLNLTIHKPAESIV